MLEAFSCLAPDFNSEIVNKEVSIYKVSDTDTLAIVSLSGTLALLPRRF